MVEELDTAVQKLIQDVNQYTLHHLKSSYEVDTKSNYNDLVTTIDRHNDHYLDQELRRLDPGCKILSEEGSGDHDIADMTGHVWIVDPLDGTLNFVKQKDHFGIMLALYIDGRPYRGYIMDSVNGILYHGGAGQGVFKGDQRLTTPVDLNLHDSLVAISSPLILNNVANLPAVADRASGLRMYGSAAMEMTGVLTGELGGYVSWLKPWDLAAGRVLAEELGLAVKVIDDNGGGVLSSKLVLVATKRVSQDIQQLTK